MQNTKTQVSKTATDLYQISGHSSTLFVSLFSPSARYDASEILHDFISVNLMYILLYQRVWYFSSTLAVIFIGFSLHEDFILQSQTLHNWHAYKFGRLSFHPILCGSRDRPVGRKVIDEGKVMCWHCACERLELCVPLDR